MGIKLGFNNYTVLTKSHIELEGNSCAGLIDYEAQEISLLDGLSQTKRESTLLHELLHAVVHFEAMEDDMTESDVTVLSNMLYLVFSDNPQWIRKSSKGNYTCKPDSIFIGYTQYAVKFVDRIEGESKDVPCEISYTDEIIHIRKRSCKVSMLVALLEATILACMDFCQMDLEAKLASLRLAQGFATLIVDNQDLVKFNWEVFNE